jgi:8-amino-7-oxononanoate synthase
MRVMLIRPPVPRHTIGLKHVMICEPLELEYLAAGIPDHDVQIVDLIVERGIERRLKQFYPDVVGLSCYITGVNEVIKLCRMIKRWNRACRTVVGGVHASVAPEDFADPAVDCIALGDGTALMPRLLDVWQDGRDISGVPGIAIPEGPGRAYRTVSAPYMPPPDEIPFPRRDLTGHLRDRYYYLFHRPVAIMKTTWGCWYKCAFCMTWQVTGGHAYSRSPESIVAELKTIREREVYIVDDVFLINPERLATTARLIRQEKLQKRFLVYGRADFISENEEIIREWADLGLVAVIVGLEADTKEELAAYRKSVTQEQNYRTIEILRRNGVDIYASLIPQPHYGPEDWRRLKSFIDRTGIYYVNISPLTPLPGSPIFKRYESSLTVPRQAHALWDLTHCLLPPRSSLKKYYRRLLRLYAGTVLSLRRARRLTLRTRPPVWSGRYLRLWFGAIRIFFQFINAHRHHSGRNLKIAMDRGVLPDGLEYPSAPSRTPSTRPVLWNKEDIPKSFPKLHAGQDWNSGERHPVDPYRGDQMDDMERFSPGGLLDIPEARRWRDIVTWGIRIGLYTYQQPFTAKSGPLCELDGRSYRMMSSYDYLGLLGHPEIDKAAYEAIQRYGTGTGGVRLLTGSTALHHELDGRIARFKGTEAALSFSSGYAANIAAISALFRSGDRIIVDSRSHRSIADGCRVARVREEAFSHNDMNALEEILKNRSGRGRTLVIVEGVYSMDGDVCPLPDILSLKKKYGFFLMVDEAHSFGALGATGRGIDEYFGLPTDEVDIWMGSLSKAIPSCGGFIAGSREMILHLHHGSGPFMFSAAAAPATAAAALAAVNILEREPERVLRLAENAAFLRTQLRALEFDTGLSVSHVIPVILGSDLAAYSFSRALFEKGTIALAIVPPAVSRGAARLRLCATAAQSRDFLESVINDFKVCQQTRQPSYSGMP